MILPFGIMGSTQLWNLYNPSSRNYRINTRSQVSKFTGSILNWIPRMIQSYHLLDDQSSPDPFWTEVQGWYNIATLSMTEVHRITSRHMSQDDTIPLHSRILRSSDHFRESSQGWYNPTTTSLLPLSGKVFSNNTKIVSKVFKLYSRQRLRQLINNFFIGTHILDLYGFLLYHISNVEIPDFYVLWLIVEHWVLRHLYTTLVIT